MNIASWLSRAGLSHPGLPAVGYGARVVQSYGVLAERSARLASALHALGLKPGDRVAIIAKNCIEYVETIHGIWHGGFSPGAAEAQPPRRGEQERTPPKTPHPLKSYCPLLL